MYSKKGMNPMRNFILAITSFIATVVLLSQVALAEEEWRSAPGDEPIQNTMSGKPSDPKMAEGSSPDSGENNQNPCNPCKALKANVKRIKDDTLVRKDGTRINDKTSETSGQKGEQ